jgi:uncharacterized repeat protein (TIGR04076 family)
VSGPNGNKVRAEIVAIMGTGHCPAEYGVGRGWVIGDGLCPAGMCAWAFNSILPFVATLRFDGRFPWSEEPIAHVCCPDAENPVVFRLSIEE